MNKAKDKCKPGDDPVLDVTRLAQFCFYLEPVNQDTAISFEGAENMTEQSHREEVKVQNILKKYHETGILTHVSNYGGNYMDLPSGMDLQTALNITIEANEAFDSLPSDIRNRFANNPGAFLDFVQNPDNFDEMKEMGLVNRETLSKREPFDPTPTPSGDQKTPETPPQAQSQDE